MRPRVGVVMCVHNGWPYLPAAVGSILGQDHPADCFVIVDDASTDQGAEYLRQLAPDRVTVLRNPHVMGVAASLKRAVEACDCDLVARLDADDIAEPWRIAVQVACMSAPRSPGLSCTSARLIDGRGRVIGRYDAPRHPETLEWELHLGNPIVHSSVMFRLDAYDEAGGYADAVAAEDYALWSRFLAAGVGLECVRRPSVRLRKHGGQVSGLRRDELFQSAVRIASSNVENLTGTPPEQRSMHILAGRGAASSEDALGAIALLAEITRTYLAGHATGSGARREISARALEWTRDTISAAGLKRRDSAQALRSCIAGTGYSGLATLHGAWAAARLIAPDPLVAAWRRLRRRGGS